MSQRDTLYPILFSFFPSPPLPLPVLCIPALPPESLKKINSGLTMIINEKTAAQKPKGKKGKKGPSVKMDRGHNFEDDDAGYDDFDDL